MVVFIHVSRIDWAASNLSVNTALWKYGIIVGRCSRSVCWIVLNTLYGLTFIIHWISCLLCFSYYSVYSCRHHEQCPSHLVLSFCMHMRHKKWHTHFIRYRFGIYFVNDVDKEWCPNMKSVPSAAYKLIFPCMEYSSLQNILNKC